MRLTFRWLAEQAKQRGFTFERFDSCGCKYQLFSNEFALGVIADYENLDEAWVDIYELTQGRNPLSDKPLK